MKTSSYSGAFNVSAVIEFKQWVKSAEKFRYAYYFDMLGHFLNRLDKQKKLKLSPNSFEILNLIFSRILSSSRIKI